MSKIIDITSKFSNEKPVIIIKEKSYPVNDSMYSVFEFEKLASIGNQESLLKAVEISIGKDAAEEIGIINMSIGNFKILTIAIMAAMQGISYEEADARFQGKQ